MPIHDVDDAGVSPSGAADRRSDVDVLRGVAICAVVALHSSWTLLRHAPLDRPSGTALALVHLACGFGVPLFLALSAIGLSLRHRQAPGVGAYLAWLRKRAQLLLPAYVTWSLVSLALRDPALLWPPGQVALTLLAGSADIQFYFVPLLFHLYLVWPLLRPLSGHQGSVWQAVTLAGAAAVSLAAWNQWIPTTLSVLPLLALHLVAALWLKNALLDRPDRRRVAAVATAAAATAALAETSRAFHAALTPPVSDLAMVWAATIFQPRPALYALAAIAFSFACVAGLRPSPARGVGATLARALSALGHRSYGVYLTHLVVASNLTQRLVPPPTAQSSSAVVAVAALALSFGLTLGASVALTIVLERRSALAWLVGGRR